MLQNSDNSIIFINSPMEYARAISGDLILLYSGNRSMLFFDALDMVRTPEISRIKEFICEKRNGFETPVAGYIGYGLKNKLEKLTDDAPSPISAPEVLLVKWGSVIVFDHAEKKVQPYGRQIKPSVLGQAEIKIHSLKSNMNESEYIEKVAGTIEKIRDGKLYQANITRKFFGEYTIDGDPLDVFVQLTKISPAPYSAYMRVGDLHILSSSPEQFIKVENGKITTKPIKGTAKRGKTADEDEENKRKLQGSEKEKAENLMIVDLMRNDFAKVCAFDSIKVTNLHEISTYAHLHHMASTVEGQLKDGKSSIDAVLACFPPGSMTGAPKIRAMELCSEMEQMARGIYSGALGWFGGDGDCELSVIIRTLILQSGKFEFQVGGGIVADSIPENELFETYIKAKGIMQLLGNKIVLKNYVLGKSGLIAEAEKHEGDGATPKGKYSLREVWYRPDRVIKPETKLPLREITKGDFWCDDVKHKLYNQHFRETSLMPKSYEHLWRDDGAYDLIVVIGYNDAPAIPEKGSAIFIHCMHDDGRKTVGCIAVQKEYLLELTETMTQESTIEIGEEIVINI